MQMLSLIHISFKDVTREITPCEEIPDAYDITINVQEQRTANISIGGGLDTVTGVFGSVGIADNNFRGRNQRVSLNGLVGSGVIPVSYTHLDVYKRQHLTFSPMSNCTF